jgi:hypothetical protein
MGVTLESGNNTMLIRCHVVWLDILFFYSEEGDSIFLRNFGEYLPYYMAAQQTS